MARAAAPAPWWHHAVLWLMLLATLPIVDVSAPPQWPAPLQLVRSAVIDRALVVPSPQPASDRAQLVAGPALMWAPFFLAANAGVEIARQRGSAIPADGRSWPFVWSVAAGTAIYAFLALWLSYRIALRFASAGGAFVATIATWLATSVPVAVYAQPFTSYAASMCAAALMLSGWLALRDGADRRWRWGAWGAASGLACATSLVSAAFLIVAAVEIAARARRAPASALNGVLWFAAGFAAVVAPALWVQRRVDAGWLLQGHSPVLHWSSPNVWNITFSNAGGSLLWTPVWLLGAVGLVFVILRQPTVGVTLTLAGAACIYLAAASASAHDPATYGAPRLIVLAPILIAALAALVAAADRGAARTGVLAASVVLIVWNLGLMMQWKAGLIPERGPLDWRRAAANQLTVAPRAVKEFVIRYSHERKGPVSASGSGPRE